MIVIPVTRVEAAAIEALERNAIGSILYSYDQFDFCRDYKRLTSLLFIPVGSIFREIDFAISLSRTMTVDNIHIFEAR